VARHNLNANQYSTAFNQCTNQDFHLKLVDGYTVNNQSHFAAIWDKSLLNSA
jgi:hypothetical protein